MLYDRRTLLQAYLDYLAWCYAYETPPRVHELAGFLGMSRSTLHHVTREILNETPARLLKQEQLAFAKYLLATTDLDVTTIAYRAAFGTRRSLYRTFRKLESGTPRGSSA